MRAFWKASTHVNACAEAANPSGLPRRCIGICRKVFFISSSRVIPKRSAALERKSLIRSAWTSPSLTLVLVRWAPRKEAQPKLATSRPDQTLSVEQGARSFLLRRGCRFEGADADAAHCISSQLEQLR